MSTASDNRPPTGRVERIVNEVQREAFQEFLDDQFPIGAVCAVIATEDGHLDATTEIATGRLVCGDVEKDDRGAWWHRLVIDSRGATTGEIEVLELWVRAPIRYKGSADLWESEVRTDQADQCKLRLNADPPEPWRPTLRMRKAVTDAYEVPRPSLVRRR